MPGMSSIILITLIVAEPVFSIVIVASKSDETYDLILEISNLFRICASRIDKFCSDIVIEPDD